MFRRKDAILRDVFDGVVRATQPEIICDIGSFNCDESIRFKKITHNSRIYAFEANNENIEHFVTPRADLNGIIIENMAVSDIDGEIEFHVLETERGEEGWRRAAGSIKIRSDDIPYTTVNTQSIRLDTYFSDDIESNCTFALWIDVEGALDRVLAGAKGVLSRTIVIRAEVERKQFWRGQKTAEDIIPAIGEMGFILLGDSWTSEASEQSDILLLNKHWLELAIKSTISEKSSDTRAAAPANKREPVIGSVQLRAELDDLRSIVAQKVGDCDALAHAVEGSREEFAEFRRAVETALGVGWQEIQALKRGRNRLAKLFRRF